MSAPVVLFPGDANPTLDMGVVVPAGLGDYVWLDVNNDGQQTVGEPPVAGVLVTLFSNGEPVSTTTTDATGLYRFSGLNPGVPYTVSFTLPDGYTWTTQGTDPASNTDSNVDGAGATQPVVLRPGEFNGTIDAGLWRPSVVTIAKTNLNLGVARAGQEIGYQIVIKNTGVTLAKNVIVSDPVPGSTTYVTSSAVPAATLAGGVLTWPAVDLMPGASFTVTFKVLVNTNIGTVTAITNVATVNTVDQSIVLNSNEVQNPLGATAVALDRFEAVASPSAVIVKWTTALELNTLGFTLLRSETANRADAVKVNETLIAARGAAGGSYAFVDAGGTATARYWLEETELSGGKLWYGPVLVGSPIVLPSTVEAQPATMVIDALGMVKIAQQPLVAAEPKIAIDVRNGQAVVAGSAIVIAPAADAAPVSGAVPAGAEAVTAGATSAGANRVTSGVDGVAVADAQQAVAEAVTASDSPAVVEDAITRRDEVTAQVASAPRRVSGGVSNAAGLAAFGALFGMLGLAGAGVWIWRRRR